MFRHVYYCQNNQHQHQSKTAVTKDGSDDFGDSDDNDDSAILVPLQQCIGQDISRKQPNAQHTNCLILKDDNDDDIGHDGDYFNCDVCGDSGDDEDYHY